MPYKHRFTMKVLVTLVRFSLGGPPENIDVPCNTKDEVLTIFKENASCIGKVYSIDIIEVSWNSDNTIKIIYEQDIDRVLELDEDEDILLGTDDFESELNMYIGLLSDPDDDGNYPIYWSRKSDVPKTDYYIEGYCDANMVTIKNLSAKVTLFNGLKYIEEI